MTRMATRSLLTVATLALALAGCSRSDRDEPAETSNETIVTEIPEPAETAAPAPIPSPTAVEMNAVEALPEAEAEAPDEQMLDDASATGMTARARRDEAEEAAPGNSGE